jgi:hypothetical protein
MGQDYIEPTMAPDRIEEISALLGQAEAAHGAYERAELGGVYDEDWPRWYATYVVDNGISAMVGHEVSADELAEFLIRSNAEFQATEPKPTEPWASYTAGRIAAEL